MLSENQAQPGELVVLLDVDNTLLDNDRFGEDLTGRITRDFSADEAERYWTILEGSRERLEYVDYLSALQTFRLDLQHDPRVLELSSFILDYPFELRLYDQSLLVVAHMERLASTAILSDGDAVLQPRKVARSGLWDAVQGRVMIYVHKQHMLDDVQHRYPARHYAVVDDKRPLLTAMKKILADRLTTIYVRQGHYAREHADETPGLEPDFTIDRIGELLDFEVGHLMSVSAKP